MSVYFGLGKNLEISAPIWSYCLSEWRQNDYQGAYSVLVAIPLNVFLCPCLEQNSAIIAYPEGNSKAPEMAKLCGYKVGMSICLSLSAVGGT